MAKDYYRILGVARNATKEEVKKAYRELAHKYHPDKGGDEAKFKEVNEAYQVLSDERRRAQYDQFGQAYEAGGRQGGFEWPGGFRFDFGGDGQGFNEFDLSDVFEDFLGGFAGGSRTKAKERRGKDIRMDLEISFEESILGGKKDIELFKLSRCPRCQGSGAEKNSDTKECSSCLGKGNIQKTQRTILGTFTQVTTCPECNGTGKRPSIPCAECRGRGVENRKELFDIIIPKSIREGEVLKISGKGEASGQGGVPGDLYLIIHVLPHPVFRRQSDDIIMTLPIKPSQALKGATVTVPVIDGSIRLKIPDGTQPGDVLSVRGAGAYRASGYGRGNLLVDLKVDFPKKTTRKIKEIADQLEAEGY